MGLTVAVVGLGKVGLPLAVQYASHGVRVIGCDINEHVVAAVNAGQSPIVGEAELEERLNTAHAQGRIRATSNTSEAVGQSDVIVIIVPVMVSGDHAIDYAAMESATRAVGSGLRRGALVIYETTLPVGATRKRMGGLLEKESGLRMGDDFYLAFSPERIRTGRIFRDLRTYPKIVGGIDEESGRRAAAFYERVLDASVMVLSSAEAAEFTKLIETTYRDVNIALANEFAVFGAARGVEVHEAIRAANSQPQSHIHEPGVGVGGHCIPVYPYFLINHAEQEELRLPRLARVINDSMASYVVSHLADALGQLAGRHVVILGLAYRADVKEAAYSSTLLLANSLRDRGADVSVHDPLFSSQDIAMRGLQPIDLAEVDTVDAIIVQAYHQEYKALPAEFYHRASVIIDGRGDLDANDLGLPPTTTYIRVGRPSGSADASRQSIKLVQQG